MPDLNHSIIIDTSPRLAPCAAWYPIFSVIDWIPADAGMTNEDKIYR